MKVLIIFLISFCILQSQTYKVDMGGIPNQYPTQIEVVDGDVIIATTENFGKGYGIDAVSLINVTKNKVFRVANSSRQVNPKILIDSNKILFTHWEITGSGYDAGQILLLDKDFNISNRKQLNYTGDTEIYSINKLNNNYIVCGDVKVNTLILNLDNNLNELDKLSFSTDLAKYSYLTCSNNIDNSLISSYTTDYGKFGFIKFNNNLTIINKISFIDNSRTKFIKSIYKLNTNYTVLCDNNENGNINSSLLVIDSNFKYISEKYIFVNGKKVKINKLNLINNLYYFVGSYLDNGLQNSILGILDANLNLILSTNIADYEIINDIIFINNHFYLTGTISSTNEYNGDINYTKASNIKYICNSKDILSKSRIDDAVVSISEINDNFSNKSITNIGYQDASYTYEKSKSNEICTFTIPTTPIQGIINKYIDVLEIDTCNNKIKVSPTNEYSIDDYVLMIQMQGATIDTSNTSKYGDLIDLGSCGLYEFGYISKIDKVTDGSWITFKNKIVNSYDVKGSVQLVGVPIYGNANVVGDIIGKPWDGKSGGVIVVKATDTLNLVSGNIDASGIGFRGGKNSEISSANNITDYVTNNPKLAGEKGESVYKITNAYRYGRGKSANGGGGATASNGGGGGGSSYYLTGNNYIKKGGKGGDAYGGNWTAFGGEGGHLLITDTLNFNRLIMGGGGGGGHTNEYNNGNGASGGGIIIIQSDFYFPQINKIISNGLNAENITADGSGGGGAGGVIYTEFKLKYDYTTSLNGGNGGDSKDNVHLSGSTGGGGSPGKQFDNINNLSGGTHNNIYKYGLGGKLNFRSDIGFYPGEDAAITDDWWYNRKQIKSLIIQNQPFDSLETIASYQKSFSLCDSSKVTLTAPTTKPKYTYKWDTGETGTKIQVTKAGKFKCIISYGCKNYIAEFEVTDNQIQYNLTTINFENKCGIDSVQVSLSFNSTNAIIVWFDGSNSKTRTFTKNGKYKYTLKLSGFCDLVSEVDIQGISSGGNTSLLSFTPDTLLFSNNDIDKLTCQTFTLTNVGIDTVTVSELTYLKKLNFSSPNSIFPITLFPKESKDLEVCFYGNKFKTNYSDSIRFDNCNNPMFLTLLADIPEDTLSFATRCMLKFDAAAPSKSIVMNKTQLNELIQDLQTNYKLSNLLGLEIFDINAILPNQLVYLESNSVCLRILVVE